ncbi:FliG C-terminal domain-containing protein [Aureliella helgolandensis]|uniref:Flagellar motor switch protein FliG n=1 Tax=Aureliella helgolandensis TaxID=2527968 RepID=A0A518GEU6_9BACT|nr:FliG C-terminal domain-containing protein [Aureliella helgolandensis]QDV27119.1 Flagellar motor switch protein FliG [Aureliella helgolandensis]
MSTPQLTPDRIRQIAILVSCVDANTARQLILHLPTETAKQVRGMASQLGQVSDAEKQSILAAFRQSAAPSPRTTPAHSTAEAPQPQNPASLASVANPTAPATTPAPSKTQQGPAWTRLSTEALLRFVRDERPAVIAVVVSQLEAPVAVQILQNLPTEMHREVLTRLTRLQEIDADAMATIDEHLTERLTEYQHTLESESYNNKRLQALLQAAPSALREQWSDILDPTSSRLQSGTTAASQPSGANASAAISPNSQVPNRPAKSLDELYNQASISTQDFLERTPAEILLRRELEHPTAARPNAASAEIHSSIDSLDSPHVDPPASSDSASIPFPPQQQPSREDSYDRSLVQMEFERLLDFPAHQLAQLLSQTETETVLLALAGATPQFMKAFYAMLKSKDAQALKSRLQRIGAIQLRDVDEAQRRIVELADTLFAPSTLPFSRRPQTSAAAPLRRAA